MFQPNLPKRVVWALGVGMFFAIVLFLQPGSELVRTKIKGPHGSSQEILKNINNSTLGFEKILVIGLPSRTDRRDRMLLQAAMSGLQIEFIDGVMGSDVSEKAVPSKDDGGHMKGAGLGSWRAHVNAMHEIVRRNLTTALILEDDVDWDVRIKEQLRDFALSTQALVQPLQASPDLYADPTYPKPSDQSPTQAVEMSLDRLPQTVVPKHSPYGDVWDTLWIGHCGMHFPFEKNKLIPKGRVVHENDMTVPEKKHLWTFNKPFTLKAKYPQHTRVTHHAQEGVCTLGYALSQEGARKALRDIALKPVNDALDIILRFYCEGGKGRTKHTCLTMQPGLFHHHRPAGPASAESDIGNHGSGYKKVAQTDMVRWSVSLNADVLLEGGTDFVDQYPDEEPKR